MDNDKFYEAAKFLHVMVRQSLDNLESNPENKKTPEGYLKNLKGTSYYLKKISELRERKSQPKFGVFGPRKRGKSSMLNRLIGADIMPVHTVPMTRTSVEAHHDETCESGTWKVTVEFPDRRIERTETMKKPEEVYQKIQQYGTSQAKDELAEKIEIRCNFDKCEILKKGGILVDTPGAEASIGKEDPEDDGHPKTEPATAPKEKQLDNPDNMNTENSADENDPTREADTKRASEILETVDVVIFCARGNSLGSKKERDFYKQYLSGLRPLIVINWKDKWEGSNKDPVAEAVNLYGFPWDRTLPFSAEWAKDEQTREKSGLVDLEKKILSEIEYITSHKGIEDCFKEYEHNILNYLRFENNELIMPYAIHVMNFYQCLTEIDEEWARDFAQKLNASKLWSSQLNKLY